MTIPRIEDLLNPNQPVTTRPSPTGLPDINSLLGQGQANTLGGVGMLGVGSSITKRFMNSEFGQAMTNRISGIMNILKTSATPPSLYNDEDKVIQEEWNTGVQHMVEGYKKAEQNLGKEYTAHDILTGLSDFAHKAKDVTSEQHDWNDLPSMAGKLVTVPIEMGYSIISDLVQAVSPVDISGKTVKAVSVEKSAAAIQNTAANVVAAAIAPVVSEAVMGAMEAGTRVAADATLKTAVDVANKVPKIGAIGRAVISDVTAGGAAGVAQGATAGAGSPEMVSQALTGLVFAPLGVVTGWYRGFKGGGFDTIDRNIVSARDIVNLRQLTNVADASIATLGKRAAQLMGWNDIRDIEKTIQGVPGSTKIGTVAVTTKQLPSMQVNKAIVDDFLNNHLDTSKPFEPQITKFLSDTGIASDKMADVRTMMANTMIQKYGDAHSLTTDIGKELRSASLDAVDVANMYGYYLDNEHGQIVIRNVADHTEMTRANDAKQATEWMEKTGRANGYHLDIQANLPTLGAAPTGGVVVPPAMSNLEDGWTPRKAWHAEDVVAQLDIMMKNLSSTDARVVAVDRLTANTPNPTSIKQNIIEKVEPIRRQTEVDIKNALHSPRLQAISNIARSLPTDRLEHVGRALEAQNIDEIMATGGFQYGTTVDKSAMEAAQFAHKNNIDWTQVLRYRRVMKGADMRYKLLAIEQGLEKYKLNSLADVFSKEEILNEVKQTEANYNQHPEFQALMTRITDAFNPDANFLQAAAMADKLATSQVNGTTQLAATGRLIQALKFPEEMNLTQAEFMDKHNFTPVERKLVSSLEEAYKTYGKKYGISDNRMFRRYLNHYRQYGDIMDTFIEDEFSRGINDVGVRKFASTMVRTGEIANYSNNPIEAITSYIRAGEKSLSLYPKLDELFNRKPDGRPSPVSEELNKIGSDDLRAFAHETIMNYHNGVSGHPSADSKLSTALEAYLQRNMGKTNAEIIAKMKEPSAIDTLMAVNTSGLIGGRVSMALRDRYDVWQKFYSVHGAKRFGNLLTLKVPKAAIADLIQRGEITDPSPTDFYNIGAKSATNNAARELASFGYYMSAQHHFYMQHQAAVYLESMNHVGRVVDDLINGRITKEKAYKDVFINSFDVSTQREFNAIVSGNSPNSQQAARLLAREEVRRMVGTFGRGNQPAIANSAIGKMFGQLGSWSMANRSVMMQLGTRGTAEELAGVYSRYAASMALTKVVGAATGLNLGRWALLPTSVVFTGGPIVELIKNFTSFTQASDDPNVMKYAARQLYRSSTQFIPFGYAMRDVETASQLSTEGDGYGYGRLAAQALGVPIAKNNQSLLDYINGQYPIAPKNPTGVLEASGIPDYIRQFTQ